MKRVFLVFIVFLRSILLPAEEVDKLSPGYLFPAAEVFCLNMLTWSFDRYVTRQEWAKISADTIADNLTHGFVWDADGFETNQLFHPYSGSLTFTAARSSGLDFWQALPYPFAGSLMWELFMENEYPSINDIITTPMSGIVLGEISYRVSNLILESGRNSTGRRLAASAVSPMNGFNMLIGRSCNNNIPSPAYVTAVSAGAGGVLNSGDETGSPLYTMYLNYHMEYGGYDGLDSGYQPFDYFKTDAGVSLSFEGSIISIFASGLLFGKYINDTAERSCIAGVFKSFDFLSNETYKISSSSVGTGIINTGSSGSRAAWENLVILSAVVMGGIDSPYADIADRNYNLGPGASMKIRNTVQFHDYLEVYFMYKFYWLYSLSGSRGNELFDIAVAGISIFSGSRRSFSLEVTRYDRWSFYNDYPDLYTDNFALRVYCSFYFGRE